jgi:hypothetical protein
LTISGTFIGPSGLAAQGFGLLAGKRGLHGSRRAALPRSSP